MFVYIRRGFVRDLKTLNPTELDVIPVQRLHLLPRLIQRSIITTKSKIL